MIKVWAIYYVGSASQHISHFGTHNITIFVLPAEVKVSQLPQRLRASVSGHFGTRLGQSRVS